AFTRSQFLLALIFACVVWWISWLRPIWKKVRYDYRYYSMALDDLLRIITEIMPFVSADEGWSVLKRTEYRIRLYRFHIPEDTGTQRLAPSIIERMKQTDSLAEAAKKVSEYPK
ncbi:MAG: hypothetical protein NT023_07045, partial [Armatimonadetes bacterium]|nr:hypothetical protein [Armatimonadota bacterium]